MDFIEENERIWDERSNNNDPWSIPVSEKEIALARQGEWDIVLTPKKRVPHDWFPVPLCGKSVLCLASGGGQQGPIMAAVGAKVTVLDNSQKQLEKDRYVAARDNLEIRTIQGNMQDLSVFSDGEFDLVINPWSNGYIDDVLPVWRECARVLKKGGILLCGFGNPIEYIFDPVELEKDRLSVKYKLPYCDLDHMDDENIRRIAAEDGYIWSHTLTEQIQGQIDAGFLIGGFYEDKGGSALDEYTTGSIATKAIKI